VKEDRAIWAARLHAMEQELNSTKQQIRALMEQMASMNRRHHSSSAAARPSSKHQEAAAAGDGRPVMVSRSGNGQRNVHSGSYEQAHSLAGAGRQTASSFLQQIST